MANFGGERDVTDDTPFVNDQHDISGRDDQLSSRLSIKITERISLLS